MSTQNVKVDLQRDDVFVLNYVLTAIDPTRMIRKDELKDFGDVPVWLRAYFSESFIDPATLNPFGAWRKRIRDFLKDITVQISIGHVLNHEDAYLIADFMRKEVKTGFYHDKAIFIQNYEAACEKRVLELREKIQADTKWAHFEDKIVAAVVDHRPTVDELERSINFDWFLYPVPMGGQWDVEKDKSIASGIMSLREGLYGELVKDIAFNVSGLLAKCKKRFEGLKPSERFVQTVTRQAVERGLEKLSRLAFVDRRALKLKAIADEALATLPDGKLTGPAVDDFLAILTALGNQFHLVECVEKGYPLLNVKKQGHPDLLTQDTGAAAEPTETVELVPPSNVVINEDQSQNFTLRF